MGLLLLAIGHRRFGFQENTDEGLKPALPAPWSGAEALRDHRTVFAEECTEGLAADQSWWLRRRWVDGVDGDLLF